MDSLESQVSNKVESIDELQWNKLIKTMTLDQIAVLRDEVILLEKALHNIAPAFDGAFQTKINTILEITSEVEKHSENLLKEITRQVKTELSYSIREELKQLKVNTSGVSVSALILCVLATAFLTTSFTFFAIKAFLI